MFWCRSNHNSPNRHTVGGPALCIACAWVKVILSVWFRGRGYHNQLLRLLGGPRPRAFGSGLAAPQCARGPWWGAVTYESTDHPICSRARYSPIESVRGPTRETPGEQCRIEWHPGCSIPIERLSTWSGDPGSCVCGWLLPRVSTSAVLRDNSGV